MLGVWITRRLLHVDGKSFEKMNLWGRLKVMLIFLPIGVIAIAGLIYFFSHPRTTWPGGLVFYASIIVTSVVNYRVGAYRVISVSDHSATTVSDRR